MITKKITMNVKQAMIHWIPRYRDSGGIPRTSQWLLLERKYQSEMSKAMAVIMQDSTQVGFYSTAEFSVDLTILKVLSRSAGAPLIPSLVQAVRGCSVSGRLLLGVWNNTLSYGNDGEVFCPKWVVGRNTMDDERTIYLRKPHLPHSITTDNISPCLYVYA